MLYNGNTINIVPKEVFFVNNEFIADLKTNRLKTGLFQLGPKVYNVKKEVVGYSAFSVKDKKNREGILVAEHTKENKSINFQGLLFWYLTKIAVTVTVFGLYIALYTQILPSIGEQQGGVISVLFNLIGVVSFIWVLVSISSFFSNNKYIVILGKAYLFPLWDLIKLSWGWNNYLFHPYNLRLLFFPVIQIYYVISGINSLKENKSADGFLDVSVEPENNEPTSSL